MTFTFRECFWHSREALCNELTNLTGLDAFDQPLKSAYCKWWSQIVLVYFRWLQVASVPSLPYFLESWPHQMCIIFGPQGQDSDDLTDRWIINIFSTSGSLGWWDGAQQVYRPTCHISFESTKCGEYVVKEWLLQMQYWWNTVQMYMIFPYWGLQGSQDSKKFASGCCRCKITSRWCPLLRWRSFLSY